MKTTIYFYTGTGNSLWTARKLAGRLDQAELVKDMLACVTGENE